MRAKARSLFAVPLVLLLVSFGLESGHGSTDGVSSAESELCRGRERDATSFLRLLVTPVAADDVSESLIREYQTSTKTTSQDDVEGIMQTIARIVSCQNEGNFAAVAAMFTDRYWVSEMSGLRAKAEEFAEMAEATPSPPIEQMEQKASFSDARVLADGRVAGFLRWDSKRLEDTQLVAFRFVNELWLIDEVVFVDEPEVFGTPQMGS